MLLEDAADEFGFGVGLLWGSFCASPGGPKGALSSRPETNSNDLADSNSVFVAADFFFERLEFLVCSKFGGARCGRTRACAVACLCPHNSISNVVVSVTIHDDKYIHTFQYLQEM